jgi:predicted nucleotidyltransferase component of viral defense system
MNWENSNVLTPLKKDFLARFFKTERNFYLTGGSALGIFYLQHRFSYDLDFFTLNSVEWHIVDNETRAIADSIGARYEAITTTPFFRRLKLTRGTETEVIDFVIEKTPQIDKIKNQFGDMVVDTLNEIGVNKMCTLLSRSEIKDIIDLYYLEQAGFKIEDHIEDAKKKDGGFDPATISYLLSTVEISSVPQYLVKPLKVAELKEFINNLRKRMAEISYPEK